MSASDPKRTLPTFIAGLSPLTAKSTPGANLVAQPRADNRIEPTHIAGYAERALGRPREIENILFPTICQPV